MPATMAKKPSTVYECNECGAQAQKWLGRCPDCNAWNSYAAQVSREEASEGTIGLRSATAPTPIDQIGADRTPRTTTALAQFDRVLGGGLVPGSLTLIGGEPGIGKSTLLLQVANELASLGPVLYVSGEESPNQIALRARRLGTVHSNILLFSETSVEKIIAEVERIKPVAVVVDSIQTVHTASSTSSAGSISQVRDSAGMLLTTAKRLEIPFFLIGHITKEGTIAGPKVLEHIVDTVIYFEGDKFQHGRLLRAVKNRFGPVNEVALYQMHDSGLEEVPNPSAALLSQRSSAPGSAVVASMEGTRPLLIEVQALVSPTHYATPKRMATGVDSNRVALLLAVLERRGSDSFLQHDVYVNVAGGFEIDEPAVDLGILAALVSSRRNIAVPWDCALFGEVGLLGEIRSVSQAELRAREVAALGFKRLILPRANAGELKADLDLVGVRTVDEFLPRLFERK
jgi:DNA repair protein RadA/Sms